MIRGFALVAALLAAPLLAGCAAQEPPADAVVIEVTTSRYEFSPGSVSPIEVPLGARVILRVTSTDVTHGLAIDGYRVNEEIPAGQTVDVEFVADREGSFIIYCTVFCGAGHPQHKGTLHVVAA